jgi:aspartyl-tRNA(Asn)/glutamyl-tRNA(Gln) amidotransferase subunit B
MQGINAEIERQKATLESGGTIEQETLHFDPSSGRLSSLRSKEEAHDYRYFPEPDLVPLAPTPEMFEAARAAIPELPAERIARYVGDGLPEDDARLFSFEPEWGTYFEAVRGDRHTAATWVKELRTRVDDVTQVSPETLSELVDLVAAKTVTAAGGRTVLDKLVSDGGAPAEIIEREGLGAMEDSGELEAIVAKVIDDNPDIVERIRGGNAKAMGALVGPIMRETKGRADGGEVNRLLREKLGV